MADTPKPQPTIASTRMTPRLRVLLCILAFVSVLYIVSLNFEDRGWRAWFAPQPVLTLFGVVVGFIILGWQLERQHMNAMAGNRRQTQDRLKVDLYDRIAERIEATSVPIKEISLLPTTFIGELTVRAAIAGTERPVPSSRYFPQLAPRLEATSKSVFALMSILETYAIVLPDFSVFRRRLGDELQHVTVAANDFSQAAAQFAGSENSGPVRWPATRADVDILDSLATSTMRAGTHLTATISDLRVEAQNYLLSETFGGRKVPIRVPADPSQEVTTVAGTPKGQG